MTWQIFFVQPNIGRHSYFVVCDVNTWTGNVSDLTHWTLDWPGGWAGPGGGGGRHRALDLLQMPGNQKIESLQRQSWWWWYLRMASASLAISCSEAGGGRLVNCWHLPENSSLASRGRDLVFTTFLGILLTLTSWLNLTWRDSDTLECSDLRLGDLFTWKVKSLRFIHWTQHLWQQNWMTCSLF